MRALLSTMHPLSYWIAPGGVMTPAGAMTPAGSPGPVAYTPAQVRRAYGFDQATFFGGTIPASGFGQTIAIIGAYDNPNIQNDLSQFDQAFGIGDSSFSKVAADGSTNYPPRAPDGKYAAETALDVEWAHALAPAATILLVEANSQRDGDIFQAVDFARKQPGVAVVTISYTEDEFAGETSWDYLFSTPNGHSPVSFVAASGDSGADPQYPAVAPGVLAAGGTTLNLDSQGNWLSEIGWHNSGGGPSLFEPQPPYQNGVVTQQTTRRANPDVAFDADPGTGVAVYDTFNNPAASPWSSMGGTSLSAPAWAAIVAAADQGRGINNLALLDGPNDLLPKIYSLPQDDFHDITVGNNGYAAGPGYDYVTGRGSPKADLVIPDLASSTLTVNGQVFLDLNGNGNNDGGADPGINNVVVKLYRDANSDNLLETDQDVEVATTLSATSKSGVVGSYTFTNLGPGVYFVKENVPTGSSLTVPLPKTYYTISSRDGNGGSPATGSAAHNFGNFQNVTVSGRVFNDLNGDGSDNGSDPALNGVPINLYRDADNNGVLDPTVDTLVVTTTSGSGAAGQFSIAGVGGGTFFLQIALSPAFTQTKPGAPGYYTFTTQSGQNVSGKDFGAFVNITIGGRVFNDLNGNGNDDGGSDPGLNGVTINLLRHDPLFGFDTLVGSAVTSTINGQDGQYMLTGVGPGTYIVQEVVPDNMVQTAPQSPSYYQISAVSGQTFTRRDFGTFIDGTLAGTVFEDMLGDGPSGSDLGINGVPVALYLDSNGDHAFEPSSDTLAGFALPEDMVNPGQYSFNNLGPGTYFVTLGLLPNLVQTSPTSPSYYTIPLQSGQVADQLDFGVFHTITISGQIYVDTSGSNLGGLGLGGVTVQLFHDGNGNGLFDPNLDPLSQSTISDSGGNFHFFNVGPGTYFVAQAPPNGYQSTGGGSGPIVTHSGRDINGLNFGEFQTITISGRTYNDLNGDGTDNNGTDPGTNGYTIQLYRDNNKNGVIDPGVDNLVATTFTGLLPGPAGRYVFNNVGAGTYLIREVQQPGHVETNPSASGLIPLAAQGGVNASGQNFGNIDNLNSSFVYRAYQDLLGRTPDAGGLSFWSGLLTKGTPRTQVIQAIQNTKEYRFDILNALYQQFLGRGVDAAALPAWLQFMAGATFGPNGSPQDQIKAVLLGSDEYYTQARVGATNDGFLSALYQDVLGRDIDAVGKAYLTDQLNRGAARSAAARFVLLTTEAKGRLIAGYYTTFLHRQADSASMSTFASLMLGGWREDDVIARLMISDEYYRRQ